MRTTSYDGLDPQFLERTSPRAFVSDPIPEDQLHTLFEAARWTPSCFNEQPWLFVYAQGPESLEQVQNILVEGNRVWAKNAPVLAIVFAKTHFSKSAKPNRWAEFDSGAAWMALALQATQMGLYCHAMGGFDETAAYTVANVDPDKFKAMCVVAIGKRGDVKVLPTPLQDKENNRVRKDLKDIICEIHS